MTSAWLVGLSLALVSHLVIITIRKIKSNKQLYSKLKSCESKLVNLRSKLELYDEKTISTIVLDDGKEEESTMLAKIATVIHKVRVRNKVQIFFASAKYLALLDSALLKVQIFDAKLDVLQIFTSNPSLLSKKPKAKANDRSSAENNKAEKKPEQVVNDSWASKHSNLSGQELYKLGRNYRQGIGVARDAHKAFCCFKMAAEAGDMDGKTGLATCYLDGTGVQKDVNKAFQDLFVLANQGHGKALVNLGICYFNGYGVAKDIGMAFSSFSRAAKYGDSQAKCNMGSFYMHGCYVSRDLKKAVKLFRDASESGNADASYNLGRCYQNGEGVKKNMARAISCYEKAADLHSPLALCTLAHCYETGSGVARDKIKANALYEKAAEKGNQYAKQRIEQSLNESEVRPSYKESSKSGWVQDMPGEL